MTSQACTFYCVCESGDKFIMILKSDKMCVYSAFHNKSYILYLIQWNSVRQESKSQNNRDLWFNIEGKQGGFHKLHWYWNTDKLYLNKTPSQSFSSAKQKCGFALILLMFNAKIGSLMSIYKTTDTTYKVSIVIYGECSHRRRFEGYWFY